MRNSILAFCIIGATATTLTVCTSTPVTQRRALSLVPESQMAELGAQAFAEMKSASPQLSNSLAREQIVRVGRRVATASGANYTWEFEVFDDPKTVNAFCLPGGKIGVYTGLLPVAKNEAGLAAVLAHEVAHATAHHARERLSQTLIVQLGLTATDMSLGGNRNRGAILAALGVGAQLGVLLPYSRLHESEADKIGLRYMAQAGYDPSEAVSLWQRMAAQGGLNPPAFLSTHPDPASRAIALAAELQAVTSLYSQSEKQPNTPVTR